ncbi:hypothetical protein EG328_005153 [Venturia inaequalis]|uniref:Endo-beta-1,6-galactanase-like domain-containing protein n=1 Tax=Venturia inaequalis TaxID=5025 RepID=A0A8H3YU99_VENIN|nr:hypothetical protein EG328_005153 [Venturia inaequalis]KAE9984429.1 hypothetical protein EG327_005044 [Venturia inaequalis]
MSFQLLLLSFGILSSLYPSSANATPLAQQDDYEKTSVKRALVRVDASKTHQTFDGMGFSEAFQRCKIIYGSDGLSPSNTQNVLDLLFSNTTGAGLTILRNGIGSSINNPYDLMKSIAPTGPGASGGNMSYEWDGDDNGQVRLTKDAIARGVTTIYADAWSAPAYMKNNRNDSNGGSLCGVRGVNCTSGDWKPAYAEYLVQYLRYYKQEGIQVDHVGFLNEPDLKTTYASMLSTGEQAADFLKVFHPVLKASGLNTTIACCDGEGWEGARERLSGIKEEGAEDTLEIATSHGYTAPPGIPFNTTKRVWQTEWADLSGPATLAWYNNGSTGEGLTWALHIHNAFVNSNVSAFLYWIGAGNTTTNSALILLRKDQVNVSKRLWAFAQYSRLIRPGAKRIDATVVGQPIYSVAALRHSISTPPRLHLFQKRNQTQPELFTSAFLNPDSSTVVYVINNSSAATLFNERGL